MALATWWRGDDLPALSPIAEFRAEVSADPYLLAMLSNYEVAEAQRRLAEGHRAYVAWMGSAPVAYGWVATRVASIGELGIDVPVPPTDRYLWDFATLPEWRGRGIYPHLLQAIVRREAQDAERCWIIAAPENRASSAGIYKAGFTATAQLSFQTAGQAGLTALGPSERVRPGAIFLGVPVLQTTSEPVISPCWGCVIEAQQAEPDGEAACWPTNTEPRQPKTVCTC